MNSSEARLKHFQEFKNGNECVFAISGRPKVAALPQFAFRKIDDKSIAILAWMNKTEAEDWRNKYDSSESVVVELSYSELINYLNEASPVARKYCKIELI